MSLEDEISLLSELPILSELDAEALRILAFSTDNRSLQAGETLFRRGDRSEGGYFVLSGSLSIYREEEAVKDTGVVGAGGLIGEMAMIAPTENAATAIAREPSIVLLIPRSLFQRILREYPGSAVRIRSVIEKRLALFMQDLQKLQITQP